jgi:tRNA-modifying protein YgfZ
LEKQAMHHGTHPIVSMAGLLRGSIGFALLPRSILLLEGGDLFDFLHRMSTNDLRTMADGSAIRTFFLNEKGRAIDLVTVVRNGQSAIVIGSRGSSGTLAAWLEKFIIMDDVRIRLSAEYPAIPTLYGPAARDMVDQDGLTGAAAREDLGRIPGYLIVPSDHPTGDLGFPIPGEFATLTQLDPEAIEIVRIEEMMPALGRELGPDTNVLETGLRQFISFSKGCYIGQEVVARLDTYKKLRKIIAQFSISVGPGCAPAPGILLQDGREAGRITSTAYSPLHNGWIGLGFRQIRSVDAGFDLVQEDERMPFQATCLSSLPPGYEEYEIEH